MHFWGARKAAARSAARKVVCAPSRATFDRCRAHNFLG